MDQVYSTEYSRSSLTAGTLHIYDLAAFQASWWHSRWSLVSGKYFGPGGHGMGFMRSEQSPAP